MCVCMWGEATLAEATLEATTFQCRVGYYILKGDCYFEWHPISGGPELLLQLHLSFWGGEGDIAYFQKSS